MNRAQATLAVAVVWMLMGSLAPASAAPPCTHRALTIDGAAVEVTLCALDEKRTGKTVQINLSEEFKSGTSAFSRSVPVEFLLDSESSRAIDDAAIDRLGVAKTLHMTFTLERDGSVQLEHAMLLPGAQRVL